MWVSSDVAIAVRHGSIKSIHYQSVPRRWRARNGGFTVALRFDHRLDLLVALHALHGGVHLVEPVMVGNHAAKRDCTLVERNKVQGLPVGLRPSGKRPENPELLADDQGRPKRGRTGAKLSHHDVPAAAPDQIQTFVKRLRLAGKLHDDIRTAPVRRRPYTVEALLG